MRKAQIVRKLKIIPGYFRRIGLRNQNFSIFSNNCWSGSVYDLFSLQYKTPTIGLWFYSSDYIKFLSNLNFYLTQDLTHITWSECKFAELLESRAEYYKKTLNKGLNQIVVGRLFDIDIVFLHYDSFQEANEKWTRRKNRLNRENLLVKYNDQNGFQIEDFQRFDALGFQNKIFYTANPNIKSNGSTKIVYLARYKELGYVKDDMNLADIDCGIYELLNNLN